MPPNISIKETFKYLMNLKLCKETGRTLEQNQDGVLVNVFLDHEADAEEIERLNAIVPDSMIDNKSRGSKKQ